MKTMRNSVFQINSAALLSLKIVYEQRKSSRLLARGRKTKRTVSFKRRTVYESYHYSSLESSSPAAAAIGAAFQPTLLISEAVVSGQRTDTPTGKEWLRSQWLIPRIPLCIGIPSDHSAIKWISISQ
ncbi:hypothetical protein DdX_08087 [Ditylenchus destructor]|uniref:Uncharacterized protein n=1 Tax=Ditylenchus destructor TaxID=166010 RepID=A0AAD4N760_9BILA|nr:hypothetical protein DdX_08087 [Ditylenchus destructor]